MRPEADGQRLDALSNLAATTWGSGDYVEARPLLEELVGVHRRVVGDKHLDTLRAISDLGALLSGMCENAAALPVGMQAIPTATRFPGGFLAYYVWLQLLEEALSGQQQMLGGEHEETAYTAASLATVRAALEGTPPSSIRYGGDHHGRGEIEAALNLSPSHRCLASAIAELQDGGAQSLASRCVLHALWPAETTEDSPFELVSSVPGSSPPIAPMHTPIWVAELESNAATELNVQLVRVIQDMRATDPAGVRKSNVGGWQVRFVLKKD